MKNIVEDQAKLLLVEDEPDLRELTEQNLAAANFDVTSVGSLSAARNALATKDFDLVIVDMKLPDGNGLNFMQNHRKHSEVAFIVATGAGDETDCILGLEFGADDFIQKPFMQRQLLARVRAVLRRYRISTSGFAQTAAEHPETYTFHNYDLNLDSRLLRRRDGKIVDLTTLEFDVLAKLAKSKNIVVSRNDIYASAQFRTGDPGRLVDGLISRLRKKLYDCDSAKYCIKTIHGRGYALTE